MKKKKFKIFIIVLITIYVTACINDDSGVDPVTYSTKVITNKPPISATIILESETVFINDTTIISCTVEDPDENESFSFEWTSFKVTENSTDNDYKYDYFKNRGVFVHRGGNALWTPAMTNGKYIIICIAKDKAGNELSATKIINAVVGAGISAITDTTTYYSNGTLNYDQLVHYTVANYTADTIEFINYGPPHIAIEKKIKDKWKLYKSTHITSWIDSDPYLVLGPGDESSEIEFVPTEEGIYRLKILYDANGQVDHLMSSTYIFAETLYSTEFEVKLE